MDLPARTLQQRRGAAAEQVAADYLRTLGWSVLAQNVRVGRGEIDLVAVEPAGDQTADTLVLVEVRSATTRQFGTPEERLDARKLRRAYAAAFAFVAAAVLPTGDRLPSLPWRLDLVVIDARGPAPPVVRHLRAVIPS